MQTHPADASLSYSECPPVLIVGSSEAARKRATRIVANAGFRVTTVGLDEAPQRLALQGTASALWLELDEASGSSLDAALGSANDSLTDRRYGAVVSVTPELVEPVMARIDSPDVEYVVNGNVADYFTALALVTSAFRPYEKRDVASDQSNARLRQLSDEVSRIAATLARLSTGPGQPTRIQEPPRDREAPAVSVDTVRAEIRARRLRRRIFDE
jgi:hypothetical protein